MLEGIPCLRMTRPWSSNFVTLGKIMSLSFLTHKMGRSISSSKGLFCMQTEVVSLWEQNVTFILEAEELGLSLSFSLPL